MVVTAWRNWQPATGNRQPAQSRTGRTAMAYPDNLPSAGLAGRAARL